MAQTETAPATIPAGQQGPQTRPVEPERRLKDGHVRLETCTVEDAATLVSEAIGAACWGRPDANTGRDPFCRSAIAFYNWHESLGWSDAFVDELWSGVAESWHQGQAKDDEERARIMKGEAHWFLALLITWPDFQGRGLATRLLGWAIEQADANEPPTPMYLKWSKMGRRVYMHVGFVPVGENTMVRRRRVE